MQKDIYEKCPVYNNRLISLRKTNVEDAVELLKCYLDEKAVAFFNSDNCNGDNFHYTTLERMKQAIDFWSFSYDNKYFIRWTVILNSSREKIGTIEMFHRVAEDEFNHYGVLRIDLQSKFETEEIVAEILQITIEHFYREFEVETIVTKAVPEANKRISSLINNGFKPLNRKFVKYDDYFIKVETK